MGVLLVYQRWAENRTLSRELKRVRGESVPGAGDGAGKGPEAGARPACLKGRKNRGDWSRVGQSCQEGRRAQMESCCETAMRGHWRPDRASGDSVGWRGLTNARVKRNRRRRVWAGLLGEF